MEKIKCNTKTLNQVNVKKIIFLICLYLGSFALMGQNITKQVVVIDSTQYSKPDSVPRIFFHVIQYKQDTLFGMNSTPGELLNGLKISTERVRFTNQAIKDQAEFVRDSIKDNQTKQFVVQQIYPLLNNLVQYRNELNMLKAIREKFMEIKMLK